VESCSETPIAGILRATGAERATVPRGPADPGAGFVSLADESADGLVDGVAGARLRVVAGAADDGDATWGIAVVGALTESWWPSRPTVKNPAPMSSSTNVAAHQRAAFRVFPAMSGVSAGAEGSVIQLQKLRRHQCRGHRPE
jgi:hypothetical protein